MASDYETQLLPEKTLQNRYQNVFAAISSGKCVSIVGLPYGGRGAFFRMIVEQNEKLLKQFVEPGKNHFVFSNSFSGGKSVEEYKIHLASAFLDLDFVNEETRKRLAEAIKGGNHVSAYSFCSDFITSCEKDGRVILTIFGIDDLVLNTPQILKAIVDLYNFNWKSKASNFVIVLPVSPFVLNHEDAALLHPITQQEVVLYPNLDKEELDFTRKRLEAIGYCAISDEAHTRAVELSGGHYYIYKIVVKLCSEGFCDLSFEELRKNEQLCSFLEEIYKAVFIYAGDDLLENSLLKKLRFVKDGEFTSPLFPLELEAGSRKNNSGLELKFRENLTPQELQLFDYLYKHLDEVLPREDIAKVIWGEEEWSEKYSEWALDKMISRTREKLDGTRFNLMSIRNRGVRLIEI